MVGTSVSANLVYSAALGGVADPLRYAALGGLIAAVLVPLCHIQEHYTLEGLYDPGRSLRRFLPLWLIVLLFFVFVIFAAKISSDFSRATVGVIAVSAPGLVYLGRLALAGFARTALESGNLRKRRVFFLHLVGSRPPATPFVDPANPFVDVVGSSILSFDAAAIREIVRAIRGSPAEEVILSMDWADNRKLKTILAELRSIPLPVKLIGDDIVTELLKNPLSRVGEAVAVEVQRGPLTPFEQGLKRALDLALSAVALIALCPLFAVIAALVKLDSSGPVMFRQRRNGFNGRQFSIFKFRTMSVDEDGSVVVQVRRNDKRVTAVGALLRRLSLDELPQLLNVLRGEMSLVGPRPHAVAHDDEYSEKIANYAFRQHVKPGITGWSQVSGLRGETAQLRDMQRRVTLDLWYIDHWTIWLDLWILLSTVKAVILARNAY